MASRLFASNWEIIVEDETGSQISIDFCCNGCGCSTGVIIYTSKYGLGNSGFETDQKCPVCGKELTLICV